MTSLPDVARLCLCCRCVCGRSSRQWGWKFPLWRSRRNISVTQSEHLWSVFSDRIAVMFTIFILRDDVCLIFKSTKLTPKLTCIYYIITFCPQQANSDKKTLSSVRGTWKSLLLNSLSLDQSILADLGPVFVVYSAAPWVQPNSAERSRDPPQIESTVL